MELVGGGGGAGEEGEGFSAVGFWVDGPEGLAVGYAAVVESEDGSAGAVEEEGGGCDVPEFAFEVDSGVEFSGGDEGDVVGDGSEVADDTDAGPPAEVFGDVEEFGAGDGDDAALVEGPVGDADRLIVESGGFVEAGVEDHSRSRQGDGGDGGRVAVEHGDGAGEAGDAGGEAAGSVDGVDDPDALAFEFIGFEHVGGFLGDDAVGGEESPQPLDDHFLDSVVGFGDDGVVVLEGDGGFAHEAEGEFGSA